MTSHVEEISSDDRNFWKHFDVSFDLGVGVEHQFLPQFAMFCNARYSFGLSDISVPGDIVSSTGIQIAAGILRSLERERLL